jgi:acyl carrier protein
MIMERIQAVFAEVFQCDPAAVVESSSPAEVEGWDSFGHLALVEALQTEFKVTFETEDIAQLDSVGQIQRILALRGAQT